MTYLVDTDTIIKTKKGVEPQSSFIASSFDEGISISVITYGEVLEGLLHPARGSGIQMRRFVSFSESINVLEIRLAEAQHDASIRLDLRIRGLMIPDNDIWIAATAIANELQLVSGDQHFSRIESLRLYPI
jgi:tRNA(fMet)-specific endonuclease VapC